MNKGKKSLELLRAVQAARVEGSQTEHNTSSGRSVFAIQHSRLLGQKGSWNTGRSLENTSTVSRMSPILVSLPPVCTSITSEENYPNRRSFHYTQKFSSLLEGASAAGNQWDHVRRFMLIQWERTPICHLQGRQVYIFLVIMRRLCLTEQIMGCLHACTKCSGKSLQCNYKENVALGADERL